MPFAEPKREELAAPSAKGLKQECFGCLRNIKKGKSGWIMVGRERLVGYEHRGGQVSATVGLGQEFTRRCKCDGKAFRDLKQTVMLFIPTRPHYCK